jgi:uncharacterized protein DUF4279
MDETRLYFAIGGWGDDPELVTRLMGLAPSRVVRKAERRPGGSPLGARYELWALDSSLDGSASFEDHLSSLLDQLELNAVGTRECVRRFDAVLQCASRFETSNPGFALSPELVARVAALTLGFDFDLYVSPQDEPEPERS